MSTHFTTFHRSTKDGVHSRQKLSDYLSLAEEHRHVHFTEGLTEQEDRAAGRPVTPELDRQAVFAAQVQRHADAIRDTGVTGEDAYLDLRRRTQLLWCACFADLDACDDIADLLEAVDGWKARADFIVMSSMVRDALGPTYFPPRTALTTDPERAARARLKTRWLEEARVLTFQDPEFASQAAQIDWINQLGRDCLHDYVLNFEWEAEPPALLQAVAEHPACDKTTAQWLYARCDAQKSAPEDIRYVSKKALNALSKSILDRLKSGAYGHARLAMNEGPDDRSVPGLDGQPMSDGLDVRVDAISDIAMHNPTYCYCGATRSFLRPFEDWSTIRVVSSS